jgi:hypothetical protein
VWNVFNPGSFTFNSDGACPGLTPSPIDNTRITEASGGSGNYTYQWYKKDGDNPGGIQIQDATAATYQPPLEDTYLGTAVMYWRPAADTVGNKSPQPATGGSYTLFIGGTTYPENITPTNFAVCDGGTITITATDRATGTYTWSQSTDGGNNYSNIPDQKSNILEVIAPASGSTYDYKVNVNVSAGDCNLVFNSDPATVTVYQPYVKGSITGSCTTCVNAIAPAPITGTPPTGGDGNYSYRWYKGTTLIDNATGASYTPATDDLQTAGPIAFVREEQDGSCATWTSSGTYILTVQPSPTIQLSGTTALTICNGGSFTLAAGAPTSGTAVSYEWKHNDGSGWQPVGGNNGTLTVPNGPTSAGLHYYRAEVRVNTSECAVLLTTNEAVVTVREAFSPGSFLVGEGAACVGKKPQAITGVSEPTGGSGNYAYKWFENMTTDLGVTAATYQPLAVGTVGVKVYSRQVADLNCNTGYQPTNGLFILTIGNGTPTVDIVSVKSTICGGEDIILKAGAVSG